MIDFNLFTEESIQKTLVTDIFNWRVKQLGYGIPDTVEFFDCMFKKYLNFKVEILETKFDGSIFEMKLKINNNDFNTNLKYKFSGL